MEHRTIAAKGGKRRAGRAFGVDPTRRECFSLRQARYDALADDLSRLACDHAARGQTMTLLDIGQPTSDLSSWARWV